MYLYIYIMMMVYYYRHNKFYSYEYLKVVLMKLNGLGCKRIEYIFGSLGFSKNIKILAINRYKFNLLIVLINKYYNIDIKLMQLRDNRKKKFIEIRSYKSMRYIAGLPIRGQRTRDNANTAKKLNKSKKR